MKVVFLALAKQRRLFPSARNNFFDTVRSCKAMKVAFLALAKQRRLFHKD
jgi:hypothetical protein